MNRKEEITEQIRELTRELDGIEKVWPQVGDDYWSMYHNGDIGYFTHDSDIADIRRLERGLCFKTKEEATTHRDNDNLYTEIRQALKDANGDWVPDYTKLKQYKYFIKWYRAYDGHSQIDWSIEQRHNKYVAKSRDIINEMFNKYGKLPVCRAFGVIE